MKNELKIYEKTGNKKELVNTFEILDPNRKLAEILKSKELYKTKTRIHPLPYSGWVRITQTFDKERYNTTYTMVYEFTLNWESL